MKWEAREGASSYSKEKASEYAMEHTITLSGEEREAREDAIALSGKGRENDDGLSRGKAPLTDNGSGMINGLSREEREARGDGMSSSGEEGGG